MVNLTKFVIQTRAENELIKITDKVKNTVSKSGIKNGLAAIISTHTTTGIMVNEGLECVETDIMETLTRLIPKDAPYAHAHFLPSYGATGSNAPSHLKSMLSGNSTLFVVENGDIVFGHAQDIYLAEFDGPKRRTIYVQVIGE